VIKPRRHIVGNGYCEQRGAVSYDSFFPADLACSLKMWFHAQQQTGGTYVFDVTHCLTKCRRHLP